jgi:hypothetical protein
MKTKSYLLLISLFFGCAYLAIAQTKPSQTTPTPSQPRVSKQQGNQIVYPLKSATPTKAPQNQNQRVSASPAKDTTPTPLGLKDSSELSGWCIN